MSMHATGRQSNEDTQVGYFSATTGCDCLQNTTVQCTIGYIFANGRLAPVVPCRFSAWITVTGSLHK